MAILKPRPGELGENESVDLCYQCDHEGDIRVVRIHREDAEDRYRFEARNHKLKDTDLGPVWSDPRKARLYAAVYVVCRHREEKTGQRGIPPAVEAQGRQELICYHLARKGTSMKYMQRKHDLNKQRLYEYKSRVKSRAREKVEMVVEPED